MKGPLDIVRRDRAGRGSTEANGQHVVGGKTYLRQAEFLEERGLSRQSQALSLNGARDPSPRRGASGALPARRSKSDGIYSRPAPPSAGCRLAARLVPLGIPDGQTYGSGPASTATMAGRVPAIAVDPSEPDHVLVGSAAGGVGRAATAAPTGLPRTDDQPTLSIGALAFDPSDPSTVYAGTGEGQLGVLPPRPRDPRLRATVGLRGASSRPMCSRASASTGSSSIRATGEG